MWHDLGAVVYWLSFLTSWSWVRKGIGSSLSRLVRTTVDSPLRLTCEPSSPMTAFSHILELSSKRHRLKPFEVSPHDCEQSFAANLRTVIAYDRLFSHPAFSWARNRRNGVRFPKHPRNVSRSFRCSGPTFHFWARLLTSFKKESETFASDSSCSRILPVY